MQKAEKERLVNPPPRVSKKQQQRQRRIARLTVKHMQAMVKLATTVRKQEEQAIAKALAKNKADARRRKLQAKAEQRAALVRHPDKIGPLQFGKPKAKTEAKAKAAPVIVADSVGHRFVNDGKDANKEAKPKKDKKDKNNEKDANKEAKQTKDKKDKKDKKKDKSKKKEKGHKDGKEHKHSKKDEKNTKKKKKDTDWTPSNAKMRKTSDSDVEDMPSTSGV